MTVGVRKPAPWEIFRRRSQVGTRRNASERPRSGGLSRDGPGDAECRATSRNEGVGAPGGFEPTPRKDAPKVSLARSQELTVAGFRVLRGRLEASAQYALVTNRATSTYWDRRPMWLLLYHDVEIASSVPAGTKSLVQSRDFLVYVDADTGLIPIAQTIGTAG